MVFFYGLMQIIGSERNISLIHKKVLPAALVILVSSIYYLLSKLPSVDVNAHYFLFGRLL